MKMTIKRAAQIGIAATALSFGAASSAQAADYVDAILPNGNHVQCGITVPPQAGSPGQILTYTWYIGNCHTTAVTRCVAFTNGGHRTINLAQHAAMQDATRGYYPTSMAVGAC